MMDDQTYLHDEPAIAEGVRKFLSSDPVFSEMGIGFDDLDWRRMKPGFATLLRIIVGQLLSTKAADTIWHRIEHVMGGEVTPSAFLNLSVADFKKMGLSSQKLDYAKSLCQAGLRGELNVAELERMADEDVFQVLTAQRGLGAWSAQMYMLFALARPDIWPAGDLGIQIGIQHYLGDETRPGRDQTHAAGEIFRPHRSAAALLCWELKRKKV